MGLSYEVLAAASHRAVQVMMDEKVIALRYRKQGVLANEADI